MRKRVVSRTIKMVHGTAIVIDGDTVTRWVIDVPEVVCKDYGLLCEYAGIITGELVKFEVENSYTAKAVMAEEDFVMGSSIEAVKGGVDNE